MAKMTILTIQQGDGPLPTVKVFKYMFTAERGSETGVNNRVKAAWDKWRKMR